MLDAMTRRRWMTSVPPTIAAGLALQASKGNSVQGAQPRIEDNGDESEPFGYCLNTSTIRGQMLTVPEQVRVTAEAGYQGIEPWIRDLDQFVEDGGSLRDLGKQIADSGMSVPSAIGFFEWIVDDPDQRAKALEEAKRNMDMLQQIGGTRLAAPPVGAVDRSDLNLLLAAERYREVLELGDQMGVVPQVEVWGFSQTLGRLGEALLVAVECGHANACLLPDVYHLYKGGSPFEGLALLSGRSMHVFHMNDYPAQPPRVDITDAARVYPGDGVAPLGEILRALQTNGFRGMLSLELFNRSYWEQDALEVARTGLAKMREAVQRSLA